jgi:hypothetical protein
MQKHAKNASSVPLILRAPLFTDLHVAMTHDDAAAINDLEKLES